MKNPNNEPNYASYPPEIRKLLAIPGVNKEKALAWFNLGIDEPQTFNQALLLAEAVGYNPEQAKVVAAQWQMESAGGSKVGGNFNYFGIKSHDEGVRNALIKRGINVSAAEPTKTSEYENGQKKSQQSSFMNFNNAFEAFAGHKAFLETNDRYKDIWNAETAKDFALGLQKAGYATAPNYGETLYNNYIKPKEDDPTSGDTRPKNWGAPVSSGENPQIFSDATYEEIGNIAPTIVPITPLPRLDQLPPTFLDTTKIDNVAVKNISLPSLPAPVPNKTTIGRLPTINPHANGGVLYAQGGTMNFKSPAAYKAWLAYGHASGEFAKTPGNQNITINNKPHKVQHNMGGSLLMRYANGGQLTEFANGGSHEENPMGGIPLGMSSDGRQNLVEQNETKDNVKDYIFSERNKIDKKLAKEFDLPKSYIGKSFAEASKLANRVNSKRDKDWDSITANAIRRDLDKLITAQETFKQREEAKDLEMMMQKHPDLMNSLMSQGAPQSINPTMDPSQMPIDPQAMDVMTSPSAMPASQVPMAYGGHMYEFGGNINKGNIGTYQNVAKGLQMVGSLAQFIPGVGTAVGMGLNAVGQGINMAAKTAQERIAGEQQDMLMAQQNPNVATSGMPVNTGLPSVSAYGGKLFAMGSYLGDPPPVGTTDPPPTPSLEERWTSFTDPNKLYWDGYKGKKVPFSELTDTFKHLYADEGDEISGFGITLNPETNNYNITETPIQRWRDVDPNASTVDLQTNQTYDHTGAYGATGEPGAGTVTTQGMKYAHVKGEDGKLIRIPAYGKGWPSGVVGEGTPYISVGSDWNMIAPTTGGTPGAYAYGGNLYAGGGYRRTGLEGLGGINPKELKNLISKEIPNYFNQLNSPMDYASSRNIITDQQIKKTPTNKNTSPEKLLDPPNFSDAELGLNTLVDVRPENLTYTEPRMDTSLNDITRNVDLRQTPGEALGNVLGLGYNLYQGLSPIDKIQARELYTPLEAPKVDYTQSENMARSQAAGTRNAVRGAGVNPALLNAINANSLSQIAAIQTEEENRNKMAQFETDKLNAAAKAAATWQALQTNWGMQMAKQEHLKEAFKGFQDLHKAKRADQVALTVAGLANPDAMRLYNIQTGPFYEKYLEQIKANREAKENSKNKTV